MRTDIVDKLLENRGIIAQKDKEIFLHPDYINGQYDPFSMPNLSIAIDRLEEAIEKEQKILIYADYDCDGIPGAVILSDLLIKIGYENFSVYIPDRHDEGYGLNIEAVQKAVDDGVSLLITIDLGTSDVDSIAKAKENKIDVIVTDHHIPHDVLPEAYAIVNPKLAGSTYGDKMLCGTGVVFKFIQGFIRKYGNSYNISGEWEKWLLDMVALATLSDMVPLINENRIFAYFGLKVIKKTKRPGLQKLFNDLKIDQRYLTEDDITFMITPRINAASRMDSPMRAFELLSEKDVTKAGILADHLSKINDDRKVTVATIMREVHKKLEGRELGDVIVIGNPLWRAGVLGLVAGKITDQYERTTFVWGSGGEDEGYKGSCRSNGSVSVVELMAETKNSFLSFGGHELAGGFSVTHKEVLLLESTLLDAYNRTKREMEKDRAGKQDIILNLNDVTEDLYNKITQLAPFGCENPKPVIKFIGLEIYAIKQFGKEKNHLEIIFKEKDKNLKAIAFFTDINSYKKVLETGNVVDLLAHIEISYFMSKKELRLRIIDIL